MKKLRMAIVCVIAALAVNSLSAQSYNDDQFMTIKVYGGANFWVLLTEALNNSNSSILPCYLSGGAQVLFLNPQHVQIGVGAAYLPMLVYGSGNSQFSMTMIPITVDLMLNIKHFYINIGGGAAILSANVGSNPLGSFYHVNAPSPSFVVKLGVGVNFNLTDVLEIDVGGDIYAPTGTFGIYNDPYSSPLSNILLFTQANVHLGLNFNL